MSERRASVTTSHNSSESTVHTDWKVGEGAVCPPSSQNIPGNDLFQSDKEKNPTGDSGLQGLGTGPGGTMENILLWGSL